MNRRGILTGALAAGAALAVPGRALADVIAVGSDPVLPPAPVSLLGQAQLVAVAKRELGRAGARVRYRDIVAIADFAQQSAQPRFHLVNMEAGTVNSLYVSHGRGSDIEHSGWLHQFSNQPGSNATSQGAYVTDNWYYGKYGVSLRLDGLDATNNYALDRAIVMHPADYAAPSMIRTWGKLGRSLGCFALAPEQYNGALQQLYGGRLIFADRIGIS